MSQSSAESESGFAPWPKHALSEDRLGFQITGTYRPPSGWWSLGLPMTLIVLAPLMMLGSCKLLVDASYGGSVRNMPAEDVLYFILIWVAACFALAVLGETFGRRRQLDILIRPDAITIDGKSYKRGEGLNQFAVEEHEKAHNERLAAQRGAGGHIYRDAVEVVMRYGERRVPVAAFARNDIRKAEALLVRLQVLTAGFDKLRASPASGPAESGAPADEFGPARPIR
ncbi:MAG: hypothetical protein RIM84_18625 [Alphaproteobacteria bacterium]